MITDIEDFFADGCGRCGRVATPACSARLWQAGLAALRRVCLEAGLAEEVKWGHPCYVHAGGNIAIIGAFRGAFRLSFFQAGLLGDPDGLLERQGENSRCPDTIRFRSAGDVAARERSLGAYLREAMDHAAALRRAPKDPAPVVLPDDVVEGLGRDPELMAAFRGLTPGRQRSYAIALGSAKTPAKRKARLARFRDRILAGKGANER